MAAAPRAPVSKNPPNQTLYCKNLPDKLNKQELRRSLYLLFTTYGPILDIIALKTPKMRGQAHIVFRDVHASIQALRAMNGFEFFGKEMQLDYAKGKSDTIAKLDGTFKIPTKEKDIETTTDATMTDFQKAVFGGPPASAPKPAQAETKGVKRGREEEESEQEDVSMEEDEDDAAMEESDED